MKFSQSPILSAVAVLLICTIAIVSSAAPPTSASSDPPPDVGFLTADKDYLISFPPAYGMFTSKKAGISKSTYVTADGEEHEGKPATWTSTATVEIFHVVGFGGSSWVLLEHPADHDDFLAWNFQRRAKATLAADAQPVGDSEAEQDKRLEQLKKMANAEIETARTWVNLAHALAISDVPNEDFKPKLTIKSVKVKSDD